MTQLSSSPQTPAARRRFLVQALGMTAAGLALGGGAAWAKGLADEAAAAEARVQELQAQLAAAASANAVLDSSAAALQQQIAALQGQLSALASQNTQLATALSAAQTENADLKTLLAAAQEQLNAANAKLAQFKELIALFDQLEGLNLDALARDGLAAMAGGLATALGLTALVSDGVQLARALLDRFERLLPDFHEAMTWLGGQIVNFKLGLYAVEIAAQRTVQEALTGLAAVFGGFVLFVLDHLPFNIGGNVRATLGATQELLVNVETAANAMSTKVLDKISAYVGDGPQGWRRALVMPLRDKTLSPAAQLLTAVSDVSATFTSALHDPVAAALDQRAQIRAKIDALRQANQL
jgi:hypothetical protein